MRYVLSLFASLAVLVLSVGAGTAQNDEPDRLKRAAQIQKEIVEAQKRTEQLHKELVLRVEQVQKEMAELQKRTEQLHNELVVLTGTQGTIRKLVFDGFVLDRDPGLCYVPDKDTRIVFSDGQKAKVSDLKLGTHVSVQANEQKVKASDPGQVTALVIVIDKAVRQIFIEGQDATAIAKQVDFTKEYLFLSRIEGVADDRVSVTVSRDKDVPVVHFTFHPGHAKGPDGHILTSLFAISKDARVTGFADGKKITSAEELAKALRGQ
jgi:hypothetical protein